MSEPENFYPMNQDNLDPDSMLYHSNIEWLSGFVRRQSKRHECGPDEVIAQVEKDLRSILDQKFRPQ